MYGTIPKTKPPEQHADRVAALTAEAARRRPGSAKSAAWQGPAALRPT